MAENDQRDQAAISGVLGALRHRWRVVAACAILVPAVAFALSYVQPKTYAASASLLFRDPGFDQTVFGSSFLQPSTDPAREAATNLRLVSLDVIAARTAESFQPRLTRRQVARKVEVTAEGLSNVVSVTARDRDPETAARLANTFAGEYIEFRRSADRAKIDEALALVERQLAALALAERAGQRGRSLEERAEQLQLLASLQTGNAELVQPATAPERPAAPRPQRNALFGAMVGILLGLGLALVRERFDRRPRDPEEVALMLDRPLLGSIPESPNLTRYADDPGPAITEAFGILQANLRYFNLDHSIRSVLVTSPAPSEGKSTVTWHLAAAAARAGIQVLLIEADLRRPSIAAAHDLRSTRGLTTVLAGEGRLGGTIQRIEVGPARTFDVLVAGHVPPNPADLIESDQMQQLLAEAVERYDLVVIDTPPTAMVSDAIPLLRRVDGVIVVARLGQTTRDSLKAIKAQLDNVDAPTLGVVLNSAPVRDRAYGYQYAPAPDDARRRRRRARRDEDAIETVEERGVGA